MPRKNTTWPEYGAELKLAAVRRVLAGEDIGCSEIHLFRDNTDRL